ncbi:uncharacterized protein LOC142225277 [Haematobia irritans]|uniref:uncharacterized protein LOC142225277 n=1 Tax=Haematobia irritans TaxID=7368 RepID=UPI003F506D1F
MPGDNNHLEISRVAVKVPPFWRQNPRLWFRQLESQFITSGIIADVFKFHTLVGSIESNILNYVSHIVENSPEENKYRALKDALLNEFVESEEKCLRQLLENIILFHPCDDAIFQKYDSRSSSLQTPSS